MELKKIIQDTYGKGKINNKQFTDLKKEISIQYLEIYKKRIDSLKNVSKEQKAKQTTSIKENIDDAYSKEKINELHYTLLKEKISNY